MIIWSFRGRVRNLAMVRTRRLRRFAVSLAVLAVVAASGAVAPRPAQATVPAGPVAPAAPQQGGSHISGSLLAQDQLPYLRKRAASGESLTGVTASTAAPSGGQVSSNLHFLANLPLLSAISVAFIGDVAFVSTVLGLYSVNIANPAHPALLGALPMYIWENEHIQADPARHLVFISRDPRGFTTPANNPDLPFGAIHVIDVSNPRVMVEVAFHLQPTGHTAGCIDNCRWLWIAGPASPAVQIAGGANPSWGGRPLWGEDISNPASPVDCGHFIDLNNHNGRTDYDHDIDVDANGVAWVSGSGHIRGYWTRGSHLNPLDGRTETASACNPIPYAGANTDEGQIAVQGGVMHNSWHNLTLAVDGRRGDVLTATEEVVTTNCAQAGRFVTYDLAGTYQWQGWTVPKTTLHRLDAWTPHNQPGSTGCDSAHWFTDRGDGMIAIAFYTQGTRILDVRDPNHIRQVGYYNVPRTDTWAAYWHGRNEIVVADLQRGLDILSFDDVASGGGQQSGAGGSQGGGGSAAGGGGTPSAASPGSATLPDTAAVIGGHGGLAMLPIAATLLLGAAGRRRHRGRRTRVPDRPGGPGSPPA